MEIRNESGSSGIGVTSINSITGAVTIAGSGLVSVTTLGSTVTVSSSRSVVTGITSAGTNQATATALSGDYSMQIVTLPTITSGDGVRLPAVTTSSDIIVVNAKTVNFIYVYPASGQSINGNAVNTPLILFAGGTLHFYYKGAGAWQTDMLLTGGTVRNSMANPNQLFLSNSGVVNGTYGSSASIPQFSVGADGRLTFAGESGVSVPYSAVYNFSDGADSWFSQGPQKMPTKMNVDLAVPYPSDNLNTLGGTTIDGVFLDVGVSALVFNQVNKLENGIYVWDGSKMNRRSDMAHDPSAYGVDVNILSGDKYGGAKFHLDTKGNPRIDTDPLNFVLINQAKDDIKHYADTSTNVGDVNISQGGNFVVGGTVGGRFLQAGDIVLDKSQVAAPNLNGLWVVPDGINSTSLVRASDLPENGQFQGAKVHILYGDNANQTWEANSFTPSTVTGTDSMFWTELNRIGNLTGALAGQPVQSENTGFYAVATNEVNCTGTSFYPVFWSRVGNKVHVYGQVTTTITAPANFSFDMANTPISTNFSNFYEAAGGAITDANYYTQIRIIAVVGTPSVTFSGITAGVGSIDFAYEFSYQVI